MLMLMVMVVLLLAAYRQRQQTCDENSIEKYGNKSRSNLTMAQLILTVFSFQAKFH